jgi:hypothetical protein
MKKALFIFLILPVWAFSQPKKDSVWRKDLVGVWQRYTPVVGNGYDQIYIFYDNGSFELRTNSWEETSNNYGFKGHYKIKKGTQVLSITIDVIKQGKKCHYEYGDNPGGGSDWQFKCDSITTTPYLSDKKTFEISIEWTKPDEKFKDWESPLKCVLMDGTYTYYKVSNSTQAD